MQLVGSRTHAPATMARGLVHQAFAAAIVQNELKEFYRLIAMLQALSLRPRPGGAAGGREDTGYLTPKRLRVWLKDPLRRMRLLVVLAEACHDKKARPP
jgi:gamma-tubulin complex component 3